ncbi:MAG TPA: ATPase domain-containing protein [Candidatus Dormibacteraeota bacterium]|nr:ATPase domain-containing protein [Candidatus Dormibacteraeota bacterium]HEV2477681.1 ATPase domain-containing protein [Candidatus Dormibacteraeota bacterium]
MTDRLPSGNDKLDEILRGGLLKNAINLIVGIPGSGKTILSQQFAFHNASPQSPALYLSTLSEPLDKIMRYAESLTFFDQSAIRDGRIIYEDMGHILGEQELDDVLTALDVFLKTVKPGVVVIDSFRAFYALAKDETSFRQFLYELTRRLTASSSTSIWNAPYSRDQAAQTAEFAVADAIIALDIMQIEERELRVLQVMKLRGSGFLSGEHVYRITDAGLTVFPRLADIQLETRYELNSTRAESGIAALDDLLGHGGYWQGAATLVAGPSGIGKTLMGLHFLYHGAHLGEDGILATFQENVSQLGRIVDSFGWSIDEEHVHFLSRNLVDLNIDEWVYELLNLVTKTRSTRVVIDSLGDVKAAAGDATRFREWMFSLIQRCARAGVSLMMTVEVPELFELRRISDEGISHLADNVILLQYVREGAELVRALTVLKTRAMAHRPLVHRYEITSDGFKLGDVVSLTPRA